MKTTSWFQAVVAAAAGGQLATAGFAQAPSGSITSPAFSGPGQGLHDLTSVLTNFTEDFNAGQDSIVTIGEGVNLVQSVSGALTAGGTETTVTIMQDSNSLPFAATYTMKGTVKLSGTNVVTALAFTGKGSAEFEGATRQLRESLTYLITFNPAAGTFSGRKTGTASASGKGTIKILDTTTSGQVPPGVEPVDWHLGLVLTSTGTKIGGTATVTLANDRSFPFTVKGTYTTKTGTSELALTGTDAGKGAKLTVTLTGNHITGISGSLLGQKVALSNL